ncbi:hypothetical protein ACS0PU_002995 [Formica fusca]
MIFLRLLLNSGLIIFIIGQAFPKKREREVKNDPDPTIKSSLQDYVTPLHYDIHIELQFLEVEPKNFSGKCIIYIKIDIMHTIINIV